MIDFKGSHFEREVILWGVRWYVAYPMSYRQLEEMMEERGVEVDHSTLNRWVVKYAPLLEKQIPSAGGAGPPWTCGLDIHQPQFDSVCPAGDAVCFRGNGGKPDGILDAAVSRSTVTRDDLAHAIYARIPGLSRADAKALLDCAFEEMLSALTSGEDVRLRGFGTFRIRSKNARPGRNPRTGAAALISSRRVVVFKAAPHLKSAVAASGASPIVGDTP